MKQWIWKCPHFFTIGWARRGGALLLSINTGQKEARKADDVREYPLTVVLSTQNGVLQKAQIAKSLTRLNGMCGCLKILMVGGAHPTFWHLLLLVQGVKFSGEDFHVCRKGLGASRHFASVAISSHGLVAQCVLGMIVLVSAPALVITSAHQI
jgi:hypothetical protein